MLAAVSPHGFVAPSSRPFVPSHLRAIPIRHPSLQLQSVELSDDVRAEAAAGFATWWEDSDDEVDGRVCSIEGKLPDWLRGRLVRNGPGKWTAGDGARSYLHAFDGLAKLVSFEVGGGLGGGAPSYDQDTA